MKEYTIKEAKNYLAENFKEGVACPCCGQFVKQYKRPIHSFMARMLIRLSRMSDGYHHYEDIFRGVIGGDFSKLVYWDLIEEQKNEDTNKRTSGVWRITPKGRAFANRQILIPKYIVLYDSKLQRFEGDNIDIVKAIGKKFNYEELMA